MKKTRLMSMLCAIAMALTLVLPVNAVDMPEAPYISDMLELINNSPNAKLINPDIEQLYIADLWMHARKYGNLFVNEFGLFELKDSSTTDYASLTETVGFCNYLVEVGILTIDVRTRTFEMVETLTEDILRNFSMREQFLLPEVYNQPHECGYKAVTVGKLCFDNYNELSDFFDNAVQLALVNPNFKPWSATAGFWVGSVMPGGVWDYKTVSGYAPYNTVLCCSYGGLTYQHRTSEWLGNYNYGYTGAFLFDLNTLHFGSSAVSGFSPADQLDWPAIDEGFYNAPGK